MRGLVLVEGDLGRSGPLLLDSIEGCVLLLIDLIVAWRIFWVLPLWDGIWASSKDTEPQRTGNTPTNYVSWKRNGVDCRRDRNWKWGRSRG